MFKLATFIALVALVSGEGYRVLHFPGPDNTKNYISFEPDFDDLTALTVCAWQQGSFANNKFRGWFSYAVPGEDNEILLGEKEYYKLYIGSSSFYSPVTSLENVWTHLCFSWDSESGEATISVNGENTKTQTNVAKGSPRRKGGNLVIGQDQDNVGGGFDSTQSFHGRLYDVNMWDYALSETEVTFLYNTDFCGSGAAALKAPIISWEDILSQGLHGDVSIIDGTCSELDDPSHGKVLRFPPQSKVSTKNFLQFAPSFESDSFTAFSVCTWIFKTYSDKSRYFFSYATKTEDNAIILGEDGKGLALWINDQRIHAGLFLEQLRWYHLCFSWSHDTKPGIYVDGELQVAAEDEVIESSTTIPAGGVLNIGQEQDSLGGGYDASQAFAGSLYNLNMFKVALSAEQVAGLYGDGTFCSKIDDSLTTALVVSWIDLYNVIPDGNVVFDGGDDVRRHGAEDCARADIDKEAHKEECWKFEEKTRYGDEGMGYILGGVEVTKAACYATGTCVGFTCEGGGENYKCFLKTSYDSPTPDRKKYSYTYRC